MKCHERGKKAAQTHIHRETYNGASQPGGGLLYAEGNTNTRSTCRAGQPIPQVFKLDPGSAGDLNLALRLRCCETEKGTDSSETPLPPGHPKVEAVEPEVRRMWAMIEVRSRSELVALVVLAFATCYAWTAP